MKETTCYHCHKAIKYAEDEVVMETSGHEDVVRCDHCGALVIVLDEKKVKK